MAEIFSMILFLDFFFLNHKTEKMGFNPSKGRFKTQRIYLSAPQEYSLDFFPDSAINRLFQLRTHHQRLSVSFTPPYIKEAILPQS